MNYSEANQKATQAQIKTHNLQMLLRAVYSGAANNRAALAQQTNLTKTAVSSLVAELIDDGYLIETGLSQAVDGPGKPARILSFVPTARQVIGVSISSEKIEGVLANLDGTIALYHGHPMGELTGEEALELVQDVINGLVIQASARLLSIGIGCEGQIEASNALSIAPLNWRHLPLERLVAQMHDVPVHLASSTRLAAIGQYAFGSGSQATTLATILIHDNIGIGFVFQRGLYDEGYDIGFFRHAGRPIEQALAHIQTRAAQLCEQVVSSLPPTAGLIYLRIRFAAAQGDPAALQLYDELAETLSDVVAWVIALHRPDHLSLSGQIADLGPLLLDKLRQNVSTLILPELVAQTTFSLDHANDLISIGAVAYAMRYELGII
jgi:predicted NBD/HSP70 family sugar kinase